MNRSTLAIAVASLLPSTYSFAQDVSVQETMVVTANRFEQAQSSMIASSDVFTKEQIDRLQLKTLTDVIKLMPGVQVTNNGGLGQSSSIFIRGHASNHVIVLVNGVRFGSATTGSANFSAIPLTGVEKIELVRGARAAVYGADAVGGVINIVTSVGATQDKVGNVQVGFGSDKYIQGRASGYARVGDNSWIKLGANSESAEGFDVTNEDYQPSQPDKDGFRRQDLSLEFGYQPNENWQLMLNGFYHTSHSEYDGYTDDFTASLSPDEQNNELYNISAQSKFMNSQYSSTLTLASNQDSSEQLNGAFPGSEIVTQRLIANWINTYQVNQNVELLGGLEFLRDSVSDSNLYETMISAFQQYDGQKRRNVSAFITSVATFDSLSLEASLRHDDNDVYGNFTTWQLGSAYTVNQYLRLLASTGTAFKAPTYNDLYWPGYGNPDLEPEESFGYEAGFEVLLDNVDFKVVGYRTEIDNLISYQGKGTELESSNATIKGLEITSTFETGPLYHTISADFLRTDNPVNVAGWQEPVKIESKELSRRAGEVYKWLVSYDIAQWQLDLSYMYQGERYDDTKNQTKLDAYSVVDFAVGYQINDDLSVQAKALNLFDKEYETVSTYNTQGRAYYINATYQF